MRPFTEKYRDDVVSRMTYNTNAIENSTLTLNETISIILHNTTPNGKSLREVYEAVNHAEAFDLMLEKISNNEILDYKSILDLHYILMDKLDPNRGQFKKEENMIVGANFNTASPFQVPTLIDDWCYNLERQLQSVFDSDSLIQIISEKHIEFERIHPFSDGNGRVGRLLINYSLIDNDLPPCVIPKENKLEYMEYLSEQDSEGLGRFIKNQCDLERTRAMNFGVEFPEQEEELDLEL